MYGEVTHVAEQYDIAVCTLAVITDAAYCILINILVGITSILAFEVAFLLQAIHEQLEYILGNRSKTLSFSFFIHNFQPLGILVVRTIFNLFIELFRCPLYESEICSGSGRGIKFTEFVIQPKIGFGQANYSRLDFVARFRLIFRLGFSFGFRGRFWCLAVSFVLPAIFVVYGFL
jgi:hypothetical protein